MPKEVREYLTKERVGVLAVEMPGGAPHAATVHFAYNGALLIFLTEKTYKKSQALLGRETSRASFVLGTTEDTQKTLQLDGHARITTDPELREQYFEKFPDKREKWDGPGALFFTVTPTWWRFTTYEGGKKVITSE